MNIISITAVAVVGVFLIILLREVNPGYILPVSIALCGFVLIGVYPLVNEVFTYSNNLMAALVSGGNIKILYKAIGSAFIIQYASDLARESGVESVATKLEMAGKIYISSMCIPLVENLISAVNNF